MLDFQKYAKLSKPGPRYTSYPTANEFQDFTEKDYIESLSKNKDMPLSLYTHLPFCKSACYFCGCSVIYTNKEDVKDRYIGYLKKELKLLSQYLDTTREVTQFHFGGGTPTYMNASQLDEIILEMKKYFTNFSKTAEISCEIDPRHFTDDQMAVLAKNGFNRISFGVQDFNAKVQESVNRIQSIELVSNSMAIARKYGVESINCDLIYGLPNQNKETFAETLKTIISLNPDRLAIFNYAHVPWVKKNMQNIKEEELPSSEEKLKILEHTIEFLGKNNYEMIGMDHFVKKNDELYKAKLAGTLRRNFQGYTTGRGSQIIGIGLTSIGEGVDYYAQNHKEIRDYEKCLDNGKLPSYKGIKLSADDIIRKAVIMELMSNLCIDINRVEKEFGIKFNEYFKDAIKALEFYKSEGLLSIENNQIKVVNTGMLMVRNIAMSFDSYLANNSENKFSKTI